MVEFCYYVDRRGFWLGAPKFTIPLALAKPVWDLVNNIAKSVKEIAEVEKHPMYVIARIGERR